MFLQVLRQVGADVLEHERQRGLGVDDVVEGDNVGVFQLLQETRLADRGERRSFVLLQTDFLKICQSLINPRQNLGRLGPHFFRPTFWD